MMPMNKHTVLSPRLKFGVFPIYFTHAVFGEEFWRQRPGSISHHFIHVAAMADGVIALVLIHHCEALVFVGQVITAHFEQ